MKAKNSLMGMLCLINKLLKIKHILALVLVFITAGAYSVNAQNPVNKDSVNKIREAHRTKKIVESAAKLEIPKGGIILGDSLPEAFWNLTLNVVNHPQAKAHNINTIVLNDYKNKLLILDFWAAICSPCVASVEALDKLQQHFKYDIAVLPVYLYEGMDKDQLMSYVQKKGWELPISTNNLADTLMNNLFYAQRSWGQVWIKDGKLLAIPKNKMANINVISRILTRRDVDIEMNDRFTYFDKRYIIEEEGSTKIDQE